MKGNRHDNDIDVVCVMGVLFGSHCYAICRCLTLKRVGVTWLKDGAAGVASMAPNVTYLCGTSVVINVAYRYRKSISIIELFLSIISIYIYRVFSDLFRSTCISKFSGWAIIEKLSIRRRFCTFLISWGQKTRVKDYNIDLSSWYEFWFALIFFGINIILALSTAIQQFINGFVLK